MQRHLATFSFTKTFTLIARTSRIVITVTTSVLIGLATATSATATSHAATVVPKPYDPQLLKTLFDLVRIFFIYGART